MRGTKPRLIEADPAELPERPPTFLSKDAKSEWKRVMPSLVERRILTVADLGSLENYCIAQGRVRQLERLLKNTFDPAKVRAQDKAMATARQLAAELGLTPVSRSRPAIREEKDAEDSIPGMDQ